MKNRIRKSCWLILGLAVVSGLSVFAEISISVSPVRLEHQVKPGDENTDVILVTNDGDAPTRLKVSVLEWMMSRDGNPTFVKASGIPFSCAAWFRVNPVDFRIDPRQTKEIRYTIGVPPGTPEGGYRAALVFETVPEAAPGQRIKNVQVRGRIVTIFYETVGTPEIAGDLTGFDFDSKPGAPAFILTLRNPGKFHFRTKGTIAVKDESGNPLFVVEVPDVPVLPESERLLSIPVDKPLPAGSFRAEARVSIGRKEILGAEAVFSVK